LAYESDVAAMSTAGLGSTSLRLMAHEASKRLADGLSAIVPHPCYLGLYGALWQRVGALRLLRTVWIAQPRLGATLMGDEDILRILRAPLEAFDAAGCPAEVLDTPPTPAAMPPPRPVQLPVPTPTPPTP
jgi:hypothetical protein